MYSSRSALYTGLVAVLTFAAWAIKRRSVLKRRSSEAQKLYLGIDCSTQSFTAVVIDDDLEVLCERSINYQEGFPHYGVVAGVIHGPDNTVTAPTVMFIEALDAILQDLRNFVDLKRIVAISGCAQQHGAVFWRRNVEQQLAELNHCFSLRQQLKDGFAITHPPVWMDSSTTQYCRMFEARMGGAKTVAQLSGSRAYERFTGIQIMKLVSESKDALDTCGRISLISSMLASLFLGRFAAIDQSDASGTNLMDLAPKCWSKSLVEAASGSSDSTRLLELLGDDPVPSLTVLGPIAEYFVQRYGFDKDCQILAFTGDNPSALAGLGVSKLGDVAISLGTSDTMFAVVPKEFRTDLTGSILVNPVNPEMNMLMLCIKNGSLAREEIRNRAAGRCWETFSTLLRDSKPGNSGYLGFFFFEPEILPDILRPGVFLFDPADRLVKLEEVPPAVQVRAVIEGQLLSMRFHSELVGVKSKFVAVAGGASVNSEIVTVCANVFNMPIYASERCRDTAALGSALRAQHGYQSSQGIREPRTQASFARECQSRSQLKLIKEPNPEAAIVYDNMLARFEKLLTMVKNFSSV